MEQYMKRRHSTMACVSCRVSKVKCDGKAPTCSHCIKKGKECRYESFDKRKVPLRIAIELLTCRVDELCRFIYENGLQPPQMSDEENDTLQKILDPLGMTGHAVNTVPSSNDTSKNPQYMTHDTEFTLNSSTDPSCVAYEDSVEDRVMSQQQTAYLPVPMQDYSLPISGDSAGSKGFDDCQIVEGEGDESVSTGLAESSPGSIFDPWLFDQEFGTNITTATSDINQQKSHIGLTTQTESFESALSHDNPANMREPAGMFDIEAMVDEISERIGTIKIGSGGETRYYGPTSTFNLREIPVFCNQEPSNPGLYHQSKPEVEIPPTLEHRLLDLYFSWQDPSFHVVDRYIYEEAKEKWNNLENTTFYSEALRNAMCALGSAFECRYHPTLITFPKTLAEFFGDRAKSLLELELESPSIATIQAMVILCSHEIGNGNDARGWLYSGSALRLAFDLGLHLDMSGYISSGIISAADADLRRTVFWTAFIIDHQVGFHLGRPSRTSMEDVTVGKPSSHHGPKNSWQWAVYESSSPANHEFGFTDEQELIGQQLVSLCELMAPCGYILYGTSSISKEILQELNAKIVAELRKWKASLPKSLQVNLDDATSLYPPHVLVLHMQYHQNIIYAHRPWISKRQLQPEPPKGPGYMHAREMCINSAIAISRLLNTYESQYTLRRISVQAVSITSSAILFLLFAEFSNIPSYPLGDISFHLTTCFRALEEFSTCWKSARRASDLLIGLQRQWALRKRSNGVPNRDNEISLIPRKRAKTSNGLQIMAPFAHDQAMQLNFDLHGMLETEVEAAGGS